MLSDDSILHLLSASRTGNREALGRLLEHHRDYLRSIADQLLDRRLRQRIDPADVVQVTFLEIQRDLPQFRGTTVPEFLVWMRNILRHNLAAAVARHVSTQKRSVGREISVANDSDAIGFIESVPGSSTSPSGHLMRREATAALVLALARLPESQAEAIRMRYLEGRPLREISELMAKSETATAGLLKRGLRKLRDILVTAEE